MEYYAVQNQEVIEYYKYSDRKTPNGFFWVCPCCGKVSRTHYGLGDSSCVSYGVLCYEK